MTRSQGPSQGGPEWAQSEAEMWFGQMGTCFPEINGMYVLTDLDTFSAKWWEKLLIRGCMKYSKYFVRRN